MFNVLNNQQKARVQTASDLLRKGFERFDEGASAASGGVTFHATEKQLRALRKLAASPRSFTPVDVQDTLVTATTKKLYKDVTTFALPLTEDEQSRLWASAKTSYRLPY